MFLSEKITNAVKIQASFTSNGKISIIIGPIVLANCS